MCCQYFGQSCPVLCLKFQTASFLHVNISSLLHGRLVYSFKCYILNDIFIFCFKNFLIKQFYLCFEYFNSFSWWVYPLLHCLQFQYWKGPTAIQLFYEKFAGARGLFLHCSVSSYVVIWGHCMYRCLWIYLENYLFKDSKSVKSCCRLRRYLYFPSTFVLYLLIEVYIKIIC